MDKIFEANAALAMFSRYYLELKKDLPIRPSEMGVLNILSQTPGPHTPVLLADLLHVSRPMITAHIRSLVEKGYIERIQSREDLRVFHILLAEKGKELVESARQEMERQFTVLIEGMGQEDFDAFVRLAQSANAVMKEKLYGSER